MSPTKQGFTQRPELPGDDAFLHRLMLDVIAEELGAAAWPEPIRSQLLDLQCRTRRHAGPLSLPNVTSLVLQLNGGDAGWMLVAWHPDSTWLVEIAVLPSLQGQGIGSAAIETLLSAGKTVRLNVNRTNTRAIALYTRLGFLEAESNELQVRMECRCTQV